MIGHACMYGMCAVRCGLRGWMVILQVGVGVGGVVSFCVHSLYGVGVALWHAWAA